MGVTIQDAFWTAAKRIPERDDQAMFLLEICEYAFEGIEPDEDNPRRILFDLVKERVEMSVKRSKKGKSMSEARWGKAAGHEASCTSIMHKHDAQDDLSIIEDEEQASCIYEFEHHGEVSRGEVSRGEVRRDYRPDFSLKCLDAFNREFGTTFSRMPEKCEVNLESLKDKYTIDDVRSMLSYMKRERSGTKWRKTLTPNTLFSPDHFEQYMHMAKSDEKAVSKNAKYGK